MSRKYTKADLEEIVFVQLENLNAMHDLLSIMKHQNELLNNANKKLKDEITDFEQKMYPSRKRNSASQICERGDKLFVAAPTDARENCH